MTDGSVEHSTPILPYVSAISGLAWPALPKGRGVMLLAVLQQLEQSQWWPPEQLLQMQFG